MNTKLHAVTDANGRPISFFMTAGQVSDYTGAAALLDSLPKAQWMLADRGYDADWYRDALQTPQPHRDHVRSPQGLEAGRYALRQMPQSLLLRHRSRRNRHLLALINES